MKNKKNMKIQHSELPTHTKNKYIIQLGALLFIQTEISLPVYFIHIQIDNKIYNLHVTCIKCRKNNNKMCKK